MNMRQAKLESFFSLTDLPKSQIFELLALASQLESEPTNDWLKSKILAMVFFASSLRTVASFQAGMAQMGGSSFVLQPGTNAWNLEFRDGAKMDGNYQEHVREAFPVLSGYCDVLAVRRFADGRDAQADLADAVMRKIRDLTTVPFINLESAADHPCQALADWKTMDDLDIPTDGNFVLSWAFHPKPLTYAVPRAALTTAAMRSMNITVLNPEGFDLPPSMLQEAQSLSGKSVNVSHDRREAMRGAHVLYCKSWSSPTAYCDPAWHGHALRGLEDWCVDEPWFEEAAPGAKFMHCLPVRRNVKVSDRVLDGVRSVVVKQAHNRLHVQKAVLASLMGVAQ